VLAPLVDRRHAEPVRALDHRPPVAHEDRVGGHEQRLRPLPRDGRERLVVVAAPDLDRNDVDALAQCCLPRLVELVADRGVRGRQEDDALRLRRRLQQQLDLLLRQRAFRCDENPGHVAAGTREVGHGARRDGIEVAIEHDRNRASRLLRRASCGRTQRHDRIRSRFDQLPGDGRQTVQLRLGVAPVDDEVLPFDEAELGHLRRDQDGRGGRVRRARRTGRREQHAELPDAPGVLRTRRRRNAEEGRGGSEHHVPPAHHRTTALRVVATTSPPGASTSRADEEYANG
jgi:hypothetical protein